MTLRLRKLGRWGAIVVTVVALAAACMTPDEQSGLQDLNNDRGVNGMPALTWDPMLQAKAQAWAENLANQNRLYHSNLSDGITGCWRWLGENVGYGPSIGVVENAYMNSPGHRANILGSQYRVAAVGVAYRGSTVFTVQEFMQPC